MTLTIIRSNDGAQAPVTCEKEQLAATLAEVVDRDTAGTRMAIAELARKLGDGECYKIESEFLGVQVQPG